MENVCICVKFSPLMKNISQNSSKCCLEIVPLVTCIENIDKIKWKHKKNKIEYIVPMSYKIIIKKINPKEDAIKMYYSCVDLLPSTFSKVELDTGDIYRVLSDKIVLNKERNDFVSLTKMVPLDIKLNQTMHQVIQSKNLNDQSVESSMPFNLSDSLLTSINMSEKFKTGSVQTDEEEIRFSRQTVNATHIDKGTSTILQHNQIYSKTIRQKTINDCKLNSFTPVFKNIKPIYTEDYSVLDYLSPKKDTSAIASVIHKLDFLKYDNINTRVNTTPHLSPHHIIHESFDEEMIISNIRIQPKVRVAKFVEKMEKEIMPLKIILNNIISKCSSLGLNKDVVTNNPSLVESGIQSDTNYNRVVYSIVFD